MNIVILAAGMGKRMHSALPKVLHPLAGKPLLGHVLDTASVLSPDSITVVYGHGGEQVLNTFDDAGVNFVLQSPQLGTGHAAMQALPGLPDGRMTLILYGDVPLITASSLKKLLAAAGDDKLGIMTLTVDNPFGLGRIIRKNGIIDRIVEEKDASPSEKTIAEINTGIMLAPTGRLKRWLASLSNDNAQGEYYLTDIVAQAVAEGCQVVSAEPGQSWEVLGVNSRQQLAGLERIYQRELAEKLLNEGVSLADPARLDVRGRLTCGRDVFIDVNCIFEGEVVLGNNVHIGPNSYIRQSTIGDGVEIRPFCHIDEAVVGSASVIGPYARLRPGADLGEAVHIGNFVEIKNSRIADESKASHLAYVGDSTVGKRVNIGAGSITCNFDGANKHETIIEDDAFIGTNCELVAPVRVGEGATVGAGTTLTRDVPAGSLAVSRAKQVSLPDWKRPEKDNS